MLAHESLSPGTRRSRGRACPQAPSSVHSQPFNGGVPARCVEPPTESGERVALKGSAEQVGRGRSCGQASSLSLGSVTLNRVSLGRAPPTPSPTPGLVPLLVAPPRSGASSVALHGGRRGKSRSRGRAEATCREAGDSSKSSRRESWPGSSVPPRRFEEQDVRWHVTPCDRC